MDRIKRLKILNSKFRFHHIQTSSVLAIYFSVPFPRALSVILSLSEVFGVPVRFKLRYLTIVLHILQTDFNEETC